jgi:hypothetical protein
MSYKIRKTFMIEDKEVFLVDKISNIIEIYGTEKINTGSDNNITLYFIWVSSGEIVKKLILSSESYNCEGGGSEVFFNFEKE